MVFIMVGENNRYMYTERVDAALPVSNHLIWDW